VQNTLSEMRDEALDSKLPQDIFIENFFKNITIYKTKEKIIKKAFFRSLQGFPPKRRKDSLGDAISWLTLLDELKGKDDLIVVSRDSDFLDPLEKKLHPFLRDELKNKQIKKTKLFESINEFLNAYTDIILEDENNKQLDELIQRLRESSSFYETHHIVSNFDHYIKVINKEQASDILDISLDNEQIRWIINDPDIKSFLLEIITKHPTLQRTAEFNNLLT